MSKKKVIVVMPAYNAAKTLAGVISRIPKVVDEIILVDDCSSDDTFEIARKIKGIQVHKTPRNLGYGGCLKCCLQLAENLGGDIIIELHPDAEYDVDGIVPAIQKYKDGVQFVLGDRFAGKLHGMYGWKQSGTRILSKLDNFFLGTDISDMHQGFRVYTKKLLESVPYKSFANDYLFSFEIIVAAHKLGLTIESVPVSTNYTGLKRGTYPKAAIIYTLKTFGVVLSYWFHRAPDQVMTGACSCVICNSDLTTYPVYVQGKNTIFRCFACGTGYTKPDIRAYADLYPATYYASNIKQIVYRWFQRRRVDWLRPFVKSTDHVLDVGAGSGQFGRDAEGVCMVTGLEASFASDNPDVIKQDFLKFTAKKLFRSVVFWESLEHIQSPVKYIKHAKTLVEEGGIICVEYPRFDSLESKIFRGRWYHLDLPRHRTHFTEIGMRFLFESNGFDVIKSESVNAPEYAVVGLTASILGWSPDELATDIKQPLPMLLFAVLFPVSCVLEFLFTLFNQSPIGLVIARKK